MAVPKVALVLAELEIVTVEVRGTELREPREFQFSVLVERDRETGRSLGTVPGLKACYTEAETWEELRQNLTEVVALALEEKLEQDPDAEVDLADLVGAFPLKVTVCPGSM